MEKKLSWKVYFTAMLSLALPMAIQSLLTTTGSMVDTIMIGSQGEQAVAAVGICSQISSLFFSSYWGFASAATLFFAQYWGAKDEDGINRMFGLSFLLFGIIGFGFGLISVFKPSLLLSIYTDKEALIAIGTPYMHIVGWAYILQVFSMLLNLLLRSTERVKAPLYASIASLLVNFFANWILIYGRFGMPKMGAAGAAVGTVLSGGVNFLILLIVLMRSNDGVQIRLKKMFVMSKGFIQIYFKKALPIIANELLYGVGQMIINIVIGHQNESAIAAMAAFRVLEGFVFAFFVGLSSANGILVGKETGAGNLETSYTYARRSSLCCPIITAIIVLVLILLNQPLLGLFGLGAQALYYGKYMLLIYLLFGSIRTCDYIMNDSTRSGGDPLFGTIVEIGGLFLFSVPFTWLSGMVWQLPFLAVFAFVYTDELIRFFILMPYIKSGRWIKPVTEQGQAALPAFREKHGRRKQKA